MPKQHLTKKEKYNQDLIFRIDDLLYSIYDNFQELRKLLTQNKISIKND